MLSSGVQQLSSTQELMCNVSYGGDTAKYNIQRFPGLMHTNSSKLECTWTTAEKCVLANHLDHMKPVINSSCGSLVTSNCIPNVVYEGHIILEGTVRDYTANCTTTCPPKGLLDGKGDSTEILPFLIAVLVILTVLLLAGLMVCLVRSRRNPSVPRLEDPALISQKKVQILTDMEAGNPESSV